MPPIHSANVLFRVAFVRASLVKLLGPPMLILHLGGGQGQHEDSPPKRIITHPPCCVVVRRASPANGLRIVTKGMELICAEAEGLGLGSPRTSGCRAISSSPPKPSSLFPGKLLGWKGTTCHHSKVAKKDSEVHRDAFERGKCKLCMQVKFCICMPTPHHKYEV